MWGGLRAPCGKHPPHTSGMQMPCCSALETYPQCPRGRLCTRLSPLWSCKSQARTRRMLRAPSIPCELNSAQGGMAYSRSPHRLWPTCPRCMLRTPPRGPRPRSARTSPPGTRTGPRPAGRMWNTRGRRRGSRAPTHSSSRILLSPAGCTWLGALSDSRRGRAEACSGRHMTPRGRLAIHTRAGPRPRALTQHCGRYTWTRTRSKPQDRRHDHR